MKRILFIVFLVFGCFPIYSQHSVKDAENILEQADTHFDKNWLKRGPVFSEYLSAYRIYAADTILYKNNCRQILNNVHLLLLNTEKLLSEEKLAIDSLLTASYDQFKDDIETFLPIAERFILLDKYDAKKKWCNKTLQIRVANRLLSEFHTEEDVTLLKYYIDICKSKETRLQLLILLSTLLEEYEYKDNYIYESTLRNIFTLTDKEHVNYIHNGLKYISFLECNLRQMHEFPKDDNTNDYTHCLSNLSHAYESVIQAEEKRLAEENLPQDSLCQYLRNIIEHRTKMIEIDSTHLEYVAGNKRNNSEDYWNKLVKLTYDYWNYYNQEEKELRILDLPNDFRQKLSAVKEGHLQKYLYYENLELEYKLRTRGSKSEEYIDQLVSVISSYQLRLIERGWDSPALPSQYLDLGSSQKYKKSEELLAKILEELLVMYKLAYEIKEPAFSYSKEYKYLLSSVFDYYRNLFQIKEYYNEEHSSSLYLLVSDALESGCDTIQCRAFVEEYMCNLLKYKGKANEEYIETLEILLLTCEDNITDEIKTLEELLSISRRLDGNVDKTLRIASRLISTYTFNNFFDKAYPLAKEMSGVDNATGWCSITSFADLLEKYGRYRECIMVSEELLQKHVESQNLDKFAFEHRVWTLLQCYEKLKDGNGKLDFGIKWISCPSFTISEKKYIFHEILRNPQVRYKNKLLAICDKFQKEVLGDDIETEDLIDFIETKSAVLCEIGMFNESISLLDSLKIVLLRENNKTGYTRCCLNEEICAFFKKDYKLALELNERNVELIPTLLTDEYPDELYYILCRKYHYFKQLSVYDAASNLFEDIVNLMGRNRRRVIPETGRINIFSIFSYSDLSINNDYILYLCTNGDIKATDIAIRESESVSKTALSNLRNLKPIDWVESSFALLNTVAMNSPKNTALADTVFDKSLFYKQALLSSEIKMKQQILKSGNKELVRRYKEAKQKESRKSVLSGQDFQDSFIEVSTQVMVDAKQYGDFTSHLAIHWQDVIMDIEDNSILVEFFKYKDIESRKGMIGAAIVDKQSVHPLLLNICFEEELANPDLSLLNEIVSKVWDPIINTFSEIHSIYFSPVGILHTLPLECYYPKDKKIHIYRLSSTRMIKRTEQTKGNDAYIYGGIEYLISKNEYKSSSNMSSDRSIQTNIDENSIRGVIRDIPYLQGTETESYNINTIVAKKMNSHLITGRKAIENTIKSLNPNSARLLHIATHGFYTTEPNKDNILSIDVNDAMTRSGLFMAGAQNTLNEDMPIEGYDDGILTALEISTLDLRGLDLVTLSACETAKGDITGDGVFGLQRGFKKAGANSILMSLWKVDDEATCKLMTEFYSNWIGKKMTKHDALEEAKRTVRETKGWEDPKYWAAFILLDGLD